MKKILTVLLLSFLMQMAASGPGNIANKPLGLPNDVPSNLMFLYDSSGSMSWDLKQDCTTQYRCNYYWGGNTDHGGNEWYSGTYMIGDDDIIDYGDYYGWGDRYFDGCSKLNRPEKGRCLTSRSYVARKEATKLISIIDGFYVALMKFDDRKNNSNDYIAEGGKLLKGLTLFDSKATGGDTLRARQNEFQNVINAISPQGNTPLAESVSAVGRYFTYTQPGAYPISPIVTPSTDLVQTVDTTKPAYTFIPTPKTSPDTASSIALFGDSLLRKTGSATYPIFDSAGRTDEDKNRNMAVKGWCQKSFMIALTDGQPTADTNVTKLLREYEKSTNSEYLADVIGALWDMDLRPDLCDKELLSELNREYGIFPGMTECGDLLTNYPDESGLSMYQILEKQVEESADDILLVNDGILHRYKNNIRTYMIGFADGSVTDSPLMQKSARWGAGEFYPARNSAELSTVFHKILTSIASGNSSASGLGLNIGSGSGDNFYRATYDASNWTSALSKHRLIRRVGVHDIDRVNAEWSTDDDNVFPDDHNHRVIFTYDPNEHNGIPFRWSEIESRDHPFKDDLSVNAAIDPNSVSGNNTDDLGEERLNYIRGDRTNESVNNTAAGFRKRDKLLGDIVHSSPAFVGRIAEREIYDPLSIPPDNLISRYNPSIIGWTSTANTRNGPQFGSGDTYSSPGRNKSIVYVNANDGMLHAFNDNNGKEIFAYIPGYLASTERKAGLHFLTYPGYEHRFYSDATPYIKEDIWLHEKNAWRTLLVTGSAAGGKGVSLLDVTDIHNEEPNDNLADNVVLWEFTHEDLGYTFAEPYIGPLRNGKWGVIIGNGYNSQSGKAQVFIIDVEPDLSEGWVKDKNYYILETPDSYYQGHGKNGMSTVVAADVYLDPELCDGLSLVTHPCFRSADASATDEKPDDELFFPGYGSIDRLYGGDLYGNLWAFDLLSTDPADWKVDFDERPLFQVPRDSQGLPQPITAAPRLAWASNIIRRCDKKEVGEIYRFGNIVQTDVGAAFGNPLAVPYRDMRFKIGGFSQNAIPDGDEEFNTRLYQRGLSCGPNQMVMFGTGQFLTTDDVKDSKKRAFYAVWDNYKFLDYPLTVDDLSQRKFSTRENDQGEIDRTITRSESFEEGRDFESTQWKIKDDYGWYVDFDQKGERLIHKPVYFFTTDEVFFNTVMPNGEMCESSGDGIFNRLDVMSGLATQHGRVSGNEDWAGFRIGFGFRGLGSGVQIIGSDVANGDEFIAIGTNDGKSLQVKVADGQKEGSGVVSWYEIKQ